MVEQCYRTRKTLLNPIIDWKDEDVWDFIHDRNLPYCSLYDEGFTRLGCIGCPLQGGKGMERDFERWPKYREFYISAFDKMGANHHDEINVLQEGYIPDATEMAMLESESDRERAGVRIFIHWLRMGAM